jgi:hypothetical protein
VTQPLNLSTENPVSSLCFRVQLVPLHGGGGAKKKNKREREVLQKAPAGGVGGGGEGDVGGVGGAGDAATAAMIAEVGLYTSNAVDP